MRAVCVFCGSSPGGDPAFITAARSLGRTLARSGRLLIYGGAQVGLMGALADAALSAGGKVIGVVPQALMDKELAHPGLTELRVVASMHERKGTMAELADGFVAMPGGLGTLEELFEVWTWAQLGLHRKPLGVLTCGSLFSPLFKFLDDLVAQRLLRREHRDMVLTEGDPERLLAAMDGYQPIAVPKWIDRGDT